MAALVYAAAPPPALRHPATPSPVSNAYFGVRIDSAVDLLEAREYQALPRSERLAKALGEQRGFLNGFFDPDLRLALDLRVIVRPGDATPLSIALLGRTWGADDAEVATRAKRMCAQLHAALPRHVTGTPIKDEAELAASLAPFQGVKDIDIAVITRHELLGLPSRPDAQVPYYFSVVPFNWTDNEWSAVYGGLTACASPLVFSVAMLPVRMPTLLTQKLLGLATFYDRLAREDQREATLYYGRRKLAPDAFAVDAVHTFRDLSRRLGNKAFALRIQLAAPGTLPPGMVETVAAAISPADQVQGSHLERERAVSAYEVRRPPREYRPLAEYNLNMIDVGLLPGRAEIWNRPDPPDPSLALLSVIGDARDACCAFRLPIAVDGTVPGFRVRRGHFGHAEAFQATGPAITLGQIAGSDRDVTLPVRSLTKHALLAGSTGAGKTTTALRILRQLWLEHRIPFLVIEPVNAEADDYRRLAAEPGFDDLDVYTVGDEGGYPIRFNPFEVPVGVLVGEHMANLLAAFKAAFGLWEPLPGIYQDALNLTYLRSGFLASERPSGRWQAWPTAVEFMQAMREVTSDLGYAGEVKANIEAASIRRAQQLVRGPTASAFLTDQPNNIGRLLDHPVILELKSLGSGDEQALVMALLLIAVTEHYQAARGLSAGLVHVTVVEEAHRLLARSQGARSAEEGQAKEKAAEAFANALAENRKYGEGMIIAEQVPTKLVEDAVKNTNLKIMHRLTAEDDRRYLGETMGLDESQLRFATRLQVGEALAYSDEFAEAAHLVLPAPGPIPAVADMVPLRDAMPSEPFTACGLCRSRCAYRGAGLAMVRDPVVVSKVKDLMARLEDAGRTQSDLDLDWNALTALLRSHVASFAALPARGPDNDDAAYCLFLHALAVRTMRFSPTWPLAVATRLDIVPAEADPQTAAEFGESPAGNNR